jgi:hypothetical protein
MRPSVRRRRGSAEVQWIIIAVVTVVGIAATYSLLGTRTSTKLNQTGSDMADPTKLVKRFSK